MAVPFKQNLDNTEKLVEAPEFIGWVTLYWTLIT